MNAHVYSPVSPGLALPVCGWISRWLAHWPAWYWNHYLYITVLWVLSKAKFPTSEREWMGDRLHPWLFSNSRNIDFSFYARYVLYRNNLQKCESRIHILCVNPENVRSLVSSLPKSSLFSILCAYMCVCVCVCVVCVNSCVCLFTVPPLAQAGATGVWNNKHKRDFTPLQSWKDIFLSDNSVHFHPRQTLFTSHYSQPTYFLTPTPHTHTNTIKRHH